MAGSLKGRVVSVSRSASHTFSKQRVSEIVLAAGFGVEGDAHAGATVKHRYLVKKNPLAPNLSQVHLLQDSLFDELRAQGLEVRPGDMGENVTTSGLDLLAMPLGTRLHLGREAVVELTGLRTPCTQMDVFQPGLKQACMRRDANGSVERRAGVMSIVLAGGRVYLGDRIGVELPPEPWARLGPV